MPGPTLKTQINSLQTHIKHRWVFKTHVSTVFLSEKSVEYLKLSAHFGVTLGECNLNTYRARFPAVRALLDDGHHDAAI